MTAEAFDSLTRTELLERLNHYNGRLARLHAEPLLTDVEARDLQTDRLRRVLDATIDQFVDLIAAGASGRARRIDAGKARAPRAR